MSLVDTNGFKLFPIDNKSDRPILRRFWWPHEFPQGIEQADDGLVVGVQLAFQLLHFSRQPA
jgi:hypothetical protein